MAKTLDLLKAVLQTSFNREVKQVCDDYRHIFNLAANNIRENTGDNVPDSTLKLLVCKMLEEVRGRPCLLFSWCMWRRNKYMKRCYYGALGLHHGGHKTLTHSVPIVPPRVPEQSVGISLRKGQWILVIT